MAEIKLSTFTDHDTSTDGECLLAYREAKSVPLHDLSAAIQSKTPYGRVYTFGIDGDCQ